MAHQHHRGRYHPSRINGVLKFNICREVNANLAKKTNNNHIKTPLDLSAPDWSLKNVSQTIKERIMK